MRLIAAVSRDWGIGYQGKLLFSLPGDLARFKALTMGQTLLMGRATLDSLPGGRGLPGRRNLVLTRDRGFARTGVTALHSLGELAAFDGALWVIGGASVYRQLLPFCEEAEITFVRSSRPADRFLPPLDSLTGWTLAWEGELQEEGSVRYTFRRYRNRQVQTLASSLSKP